MRRNARVDANQNSIVKDLRRLGATVQTLHFVGAGFPDILVGWRGHNVLFEIKDGSKPPSARTLTDDEIIFHETWRGQVDVITCLDDALTILNLLS